MVELRNLRRWKIGRLGEGSEVSNVLFLSSLQETCCPCVFTGEELCTGLKRGCALDCPFGFLTDAHSCEICRCRPRPKKCRLIICDKYCPFGYLYVLLKSEDLFLIICNLTKCLLLFLLAVLCVFVNESAMYWIQNIYTCFVRGIRKQGKEVSPKIRIKFYSFLKMDQSLVMTLRGC